MFEVQRDRTVRDDRVARLTDLQLALVLPHHVPQFWLLHNGQQCIDEMLEQTEGETLPWQL